MLPKFRKGGRVLTGKRYLTLFCVDLEQKAIERIQMVFEMSIRIYRESLVITDSEGKDALSAGKLQDGRESHMRWCII